MMKRALLVGINETLMAPFLRGCVPDVQNVYNLLVEDYGFGSDDIRVLLNQRATREAIESRLRWLVHEAKPGDTLLFYFSGYGSQVRVRNGNGLRDRLDEILCPFDFCWDDPLTDDVIRDVFLKLKKNIHLYTVFDCCHSGTGTKSIGPSRGEIQRHTEEGNLERLSARYYAPPLDVWYRSWKRDLPIKKIGIKQKLVEVSEETSMEKMFVSDEKMRHVFISACKSSQTAADAIMQGKPCGALTHCLLSCLAKDKTGKQPLNELVADVNAMLSTYRFKQEVQLEGPGELLTQPFLVDPEV